jgi:hypothetical protein
MEIAPRQQPVRPAERELTVIAADVSSRIFSVVR